ncbi:MAG: hypothetical protein JW874_04715 [Spirochaetales bacterium]|nr:hypothetical protein [Spirochaetales bacterium]
MSEKIPEKLQQWFSSFFYLKTGINLGNHKKYLFESRLQKMFILFPQISGWNDLYHELQMERDKALVSAFVDLLVTNFSYFMRDPVHFRFLRYYLINKYDRSKPLLIWSAACAGGEEAYSIAFTVLSSLANPSPEMIKILATDISQAMLEKGKKGIYRKTHLAGRPDRSLEKYFSDIDINHIQVKAGAKEFVRFRYHNLLRLYPGARKFRIIFLRNMLIYLKKREKELVLQNIARQLEPDGYLIIGNSETLLDLNHPFVQIGYNIYRLKKPFV